MVVTNVVNPTAFSLKMVVLGLRLTTFVTEVLARRFKSCWFDDVCNVGRPPVARPGPPPPTGTAASPVGQLGRLSETAIAFAGAKWVSLVQFSGAEVMPVSRLPCWGRAVVLLVSMSPCCRASCAKKFAQRTKNGSKSAFCGVLGEFFRGPAVVGSHGASCVAPQPR